jgi:hypothetical protein
LVKSARAIEARAAVGNWILQRRSAVIHFREPGCSMTWRTQVATISVPTTLAFTAECESLGSNRHNSGSGWPANQMEEEVL